MLPRAPMRSPNLIAVYKEGVGLINMDSQAPNKVAGEWLATQGYTLVKPEYKYGNSRVDFYMEKDETKYLMEVKGCTLEIEGTGYFPDAPTERGVKHLCELTEAQKKGFCCAICFVIQIPGVKKVLPNGVTHPEFERAYVNAREAGVKVIYLCCDVQEDTLKVTQALIESSMK